MAKAKTDKEPLTPPKREAAQAVEAELDLDATVAGVIIAIAARRPKGRKTESSPTKR
jgi:hypothetical protein